MRRMRKLLPVLILVLIFVVGLLLTSPTKAQNGTIWLPFDGTSEPAEPSLALLSSSPSQVNLQAVLPGSYADTIRVEGTTYTRLLASGYGYPAVYGLPELPVLRREVEIPFGAQVSFELISSQYTDSTLLGLGLNPIYPMQPPVPKVEGVEENQPFIIDSQYYANGSLYPSSVVSLGEPYIIRGHRLLPVEIWPVGYDPMQGSLRLYSQVTFRLHLSGADMPATNTLANRYSSQEYDLTLSERVLNYNQGRPLGVNQQPGYLIITADAYVDAIVPLADLRQSRGFDVTLTRQSDIPNGTTTAGIKAYIQTAYDTWPVPPSYVLLVGDTNTIPTWTGPTIGTSTDLYYGTMDGESDWHPDIGRGRFPVRSVAQTTAMVNKYLAYSGLTGQEPWLKTASFPATCDNYQVAEGSHNYVMDTHTAPGGWTGTFPVNPTPGGDKLYCITHDATHADLVEQFNLGRWAIIYSGHGSYSGWEMDYTPTDIQNITNYGMYPFVASHACLSGDYGQTEVFGETWVLQENKGALVYWGSSTYSYWGEDDVLERVMFDSLFDNTTSYPDVATMTDAGLAGVEAAYPSSARYYRETYNVLGDPTVKLFMEPELPIFTLSAEPSSLEVCTQGTLTSDVVIGSIMGYSSTVYLETDEPPFNVVASFDPSQAAAPYTSTLTLDVSAGAPEGDHTLTITATDQVSFTMHTQLNLRINTASPNVPTLISPADGATNQPFTPSFGWENQLLTRSYNFELASSPLFESPIVIETGLTAPSYTLSNPLAGGACYWWRTQAANVCGTGAWADPFHFSTVSLFASFIDDMESGDGQWTHAATQGIDHWVISDDQSHSPTQAWFVPDDGDITDTRLWNTNPVLVGEGSVLTFWHQYQFEGTSYDGSVLEISTDGGDSWIDLGPYITANGYNGTISSGYSNPLAGRDGWTDDLTTWTEVTADLGSFAGQSVIIRWRLGCDSSVGDIGWYIDDVQITSPLPPNPNPTLWTIFPDTGDSSDPTLVVITGENFIGSPALKLGDTWLESVVVESPTTINAIVPAGMPDGVYDLTIYNGDCQQAVLIEAFTVTSAPVPISGLEATNDSPTYIGGTTHFIATVETGNGVSYAWAFGDGSQGTGRTPQHVYPDLGIYTAIVTATNVLNSEIATTTVTIVEEPITGLQAVNDSPTELGNPTALAATIATGTNVTYEWDFGDGMTGTGDVLTHTFSSAGLYTAIVTAFNDVGSESASTEIIITDVPITGLTAANSSPTELGSLTTLTATIEAGTNVTYAWDYGDGATGIGDLTTHAYPAIGIYTAIVTATNSTGSAVTDTMLTIVDAPITGLTAANDSPTLLGYTTTLTATLLNGTNVTYEWNFGDGTSGSEAVELHTYPAVGSYTAVVTVTNSVSTASISTAVTVTDVPITGLLAANDGPTELGNLTTLTATLLNGTHITYAWDFGDGTLGIGAVGIHTYPAVGNYTAVVTATNGISSESAETVVTITDVPITGLLATNDSPMELGNLTTLSATIVNGTHVIYTWDFGDGTAGIGPVVTHLYTAAGDYIATVTAANSMGNMSATTPVVITEPPQVVHFTYLPVTFR